VRIWVSGIFANSFIAAAFLMFLSVQDFFESWSSRRFLQIIFSITGRFHFFKRPVMDFKKGTPGRLHIYIIQID
jgi:hypothetical protein